MDRAVLHAVTGAMAGEQAVIAAAEEQLRALEETQGYAAGLAQLAVSEAYALSQRQYASVLLRKYVEKNWSKILEKAGSLEPSEEEKAVVRQLSFAGLSDVQSKIRVSSAAVVSKIAQVDWPDAWPDLFDRLLELLSNGTAFQVHGAMRVLTEFMREDVTVEQLAQVGPALLPQLLRILCASEIYSLRTRASSITIFRNCIEMLYVLKEEHPKATHAFLAPMVPAWMQTFTKLLESTRGEDVNRGGHIIMFEIVKTADQLLAAFPKLISSYIMGLLQPIWNEISRLRVHFVAELVQGVPEAGAEVFPNTQDSDGDVLSLESLLFTMFDLLSHLARKNALRHFFLGTAANGTGSNNGEANEVGILRELVWIAVSFMQTTEEQVEAWNSDPNQFVADEDEETYTYSVRIAAQGLLTTLLDKFQTETISALEAATQKHLEEANQARLNGGRTWWKVKEACLLAVGQVATDLIDALQEPNSPVKFDLAGLFDHVVLASMQQSEHPFLQGRAFVFASQFAQVLPAHLAAQYLSAAVAAVQPGHAVPVRVSALRALNNFCRHLDPQHVVAVQGNILRDVSRMVTGSTEETLILVLETLLSAVKVNADVAAQYEGYVLPVVLDVWSRFATDHILSGLTGDMFEALASNTKIFPSLQRRTLPTLLSIISGRAGEEVPVSAAVELVGTIIKAAPSPLPQEYVGQVFPPLMEMLMATDDREVLQNGQECLKSLVQRDTPGLVHWTGEIAGEQCSGLKHVFRFVARLLHPSQPESAAAFVGDLIVKVIKKGCDHVTSFLPELLMAIAHRLAAAQTPTFVQSLVIVFSHLIQSQTGTIIEFLSALDINGKNGLEVLLTAWCENHETFTGYYTQKVSTLGLAKLFASSDSRINGTYVRGDLLTAPSRIMTRSQTKKSPLQYSSMPAPIKIVKLLIADFKSSLEEEVDHTGKCEDVGDDSEDEDADGWEDVDDSPFAASENYTYLSDLVGENFDHFGENEDEDDPDLKDDPTYMMNMKDYLAEMFSAFAAGNINNFVSICEHSLTAAEREVLLKVPLPS